jgi:hypothetical protein
MGRLKSRFVRALVEMLQQGTSGTALPRLRHGLPPHWLRVLSREVFASTDPDATLDLDTGIDLLLAMERLLSAGTGKVMIAAASSLASRVLYGSPGLVVPGDSVRTLRHLRAPFEHPFLGTELRFTVQGSEPAFTLELAFDGLPTAARWLAWSGLGYVQAASSFSGHDPAHFRFEPQLSGELVRISVRRIHTGVVALPSSPARSSSSSVRPALRSLPARRRTPPTNAAARVEQILSRAQSSRAAENTAELATGTTLPVSAARRASSTPPSSSVAPGSGTPAQSSPAQGGTPAQSGTRPALGSTLQLPRKSAL